VNVGGTERSDQLMEPSWDENRLNVSGADQGLRLEEKGKFCKPTGQFRNEQGRWFQPEGVYGRTGTYGVEGQVGVKGSYGTYVKPEGTYRTHERVFMSQEGHFVMPKGASEPIVRGPNEPLLDERQPVAGRDTGGVPGLLITDDQGRSWAVSDKDAVKNVEQNPTLTGRTRAGHEIPV
jgi:hypothetical protein